MVLPMLLPTPSFAYAFVVLICVLIEDDGRDELLASRMEIKAESRELATASTCRREHCRAQQEVQLSHQLGTRREGRQKLYKKLRMLCGRLGNDIT